jgi:hypothetical protein
MADKVRCAECGLLALSDPIDGGSREATAKVRKSGRDTTTEKLATFICEINSPSFPKQSDGNSDERAAAINIQITCDSQVSMHPGTPPKDLVQMNLLRTVESRNATHQAEMRKLFDDFKTGVQRDAANSGTLARRALIVSIATAVIVLAVGLAQIYVAKSLPAGASTATTPTAPAATTPPPAAQKPAE